MSLKFRLALAGVLCVAALAAQQWIDGNGFPIAADFSTLNVPIVLTTSGLTQLVAPVNGARIRISHLSFSTTAAEDIQLFTSSGPACAGAGALSGVYKSVQSMALDFEAGTLRLAAGQGLCLNQSAVQNLGGLLVYGQHP